MERNTRQKEIILENIIGDTSHPTINELVTKIQSKYPDIGQATIYRNVNKLVSDGIIDKVPSSLDVNHYDYNTNPHNHLICMKCGKIIDLFEDNNYTKSVKTIQKQYSFTVNKVTNSI